MCKNLNKGLCKNIQPIFKYTLQHNNDNSFCHSTTKSTTTILLVVFQRQNHWILSLQIYYYAYTRYNQWTTWKRDENLLEKHYMEKGWPKKS